MKKLAFILAIFMCLTSTMFFSGCNTITQKSTVNQENSNSLISTESNIDMVLNSLYDENSKSYLIYTADDLLKLREVSGVKISGNFKLCANINLSGKIWTPIGSINTPFTGTFDGQGYKISGLKNYSGDFGNSLEYLSSSETHYLNMVSNTYRIGLFTRIDDGATIKNLTIENAKLASNFKAGAIASEAYNSTIQNCNVINSTIEACYCGNTKNVWGNSAEQLIYAGGFLGTASNVTINNCIGINNSVYATDHVIYSSGFGGTVKSIAGGIVGELDDGSNIGASTLQYCLNSVSEDKIDSCYIVSGHYPNDQIEKYFTNDYYKNAFNNNGNPIFLTVDHSYAGGITGLNWSPINGCQNNSKIYAGNTQNVQLSYAGGISGSSLSEINNCANFGDVTAKALEVREDNSKSFLEDNLADTSLNTLNITNQYKELDRGRTLSMSISEDYYGRLRVDVGNNRITSKTSKDNSNLVLYGDGGKVSALDCTTNYKIGAKLSSYHGSNPFDIKLKKKSTSQIISPMTDYQYTMYFQYTTEEVSVHAYSGGIVGYVSPGINVNYCFVKSNVHGGYHIMKYKPSLTTWISGDSGSNAYASACYYAIQQHSSQIIGNEPKVYASLSNFENYYIGQSVTSTKVQIPGSANVDYFYNTQNNKEVDSNPSNYFRETKGNPNLDFMGGGYRDVEYEGVTYTVYNTGDGTERISCDSCFVFNNDIPSLRISNRVAYSFNYILNVPTYNDPIYELSAIGDTAERINHDGFFTPFVFKEDCVTNISKAINAEDIDQKALLDLINNSNEWAQNDSINNGYPYIKGIYY